MKKRILGSLVVILYGIALYFSPKELYHVLIYILGVGVLSELFQISKLGKDSSSYLTSLLLFSLTYSVGVNFPDLLFLIPTFTLIFLFLGFLITEKEVPETFFPLSLFFIYSLVGITAMGNLSKKGFLLLITLAWSVDTFAYLTGKLLGKRKLTPKISPKKTVEGAIGGTLGGTLATLFVSNFLGVPVSKIYVILIFLLTVVAQVGDLLESALKRSFNVKDSGEVIPGHGGILDRLDSSLALAPFILLLGGAI